MGFVFVMESSVASFVVGAGACAASVAIFRAVAKSDFVAQFGLAVSLAGQALMVFGAAQWFERSVIGIALYVALQQALLFVLVPNFVHRLWAALSCALAATYAMLDAGLYAFTPAATTAVFAWAALSEFKLARHGEMLRAGVYGLALTAVVAAVMHGHLLGGLPLGFGRRVFDLDQTGAWLGRIASLAVLLWAVLMLLRREGLALSSGQGRIGLAGAVILGSRVDQGARRRARGSDPDRRLRQCRPRAGGARHFRAARLPVALLLLVAGHLAGKVGPAGRGRHRASRGPAGDAPLVAR